MEGRKVMNKQNMIILSDTNVNPLIRFLSGSFQGLSLEVTEGPYDQVYQSLMDTSHSVWNKPANMLFLWTVPEKAIPSFNKLIDFRSEFNINDILKEVDFFCELVLKQKNKYKHIFISSWSILPDLRWIQTLTCKHNRGLSNILMQMNLRLAERLGDSDHIIILDTQYWYASLQKKSYDAKMYALGKIRYSRDYFELAGKEIRSIISGLYGQSRKLIICDLDNTLWGGIIGDDGISNIKLGGIDPVGESFQLFQKELLFLKRRGIILAICSKNSQEIAMEMIETHPEMILRKEDFAALKINWEDKAGNILEIVKELNLGLQSVVFLDDNPTERERIKQIFPEVLVPELPIEFTRYPEFIQRLDCFESQVVTKEDLIRTEWYGQEKERDLNRLKVDSLNEWLHSLEINLTVHKLDETSLKRAVQLLNKTNQFNMATHRYSEKEFWTWSLIPGNFVFIFDVNDKFGSSGSTGLISVKLQPYNKVELQDFVMSCRVMGKNIEEAMLAYICKYFNTSNIIANYIETPKNQPFNIFISNWLEINEEEQKLLLAELKMPNYISLIEGVNIDG